ncbi:hypothetical protein BN159_2143 [Streptomyces davaonensis JCM 4913]|uniref:Carrier domain-containing protein n=1 Tax=Streptomyces davaonensis (strain DSM 101723 / JCM 4913 / KCC S-0913 / 768) TaxID=1214101 RepID=K4R036_STRDJ|nr:acyltransferase domain-containing protein [Streptomyces davaonensis]CCK26522.1 hypothetical protein BN159_2143 [Streptomyces davaonensis JCM 4913]
MADERRRFSAGLRIAVIGAGGRPVGSVSSAEEFDHDLFGLPEKDLPVARRRLMTVAWEALEHAGLPPRRLEGDRPAVFLAAEGAEPTRLRLGPHDAPVTACPSWLDAVRLAGESLRQGECRTALAAVSPLEADEGCAVLVLRLWEDARRDGDPVRSVLDPAEASADGTALVDLAEAVLRTGELAPEPPRPEPELLSPAVFPLSSSSPAALRADAGRLAELLAAPPAPHPADIASTLVRHRAHLAERAVVVARAPGELEAGLRAVAAGASVPGVVTGRALPAAGSGVVWVFSGDGSQWTGMGRELLEHEPAFGAFLDEVDPVFRAEGGYSPRDLLATWDVAEARCGRLQGICFAMQAALARVWHEHGVEPAAVIGHSGGEIAAAVAAGALSATDGALLVCRRSALLPRVAGAGTMALVDLPPDEVEAALRGRGDVVVGIRASSTTTVVSGDLDAVERLIGQWAAEGRFVRAVATDVAPHSPHMDPLLDEVRAGLAPLRPRAPRVPLYTSSLDDPRGADHFGPDYWAANLRNTVRFDAAVTAAAEDGYRIFLEISGHPLVTQSIQETLGAQGVDDAVVLPTLLRHRPERTTLLTQLGALHCHGAPVDLAARAPRGRLVDLPVRTWRRPTAEDQERTRSQDGPARRSDWHELPPDELAERLTETVRDLVTDQLGLKPAELDDERPLAEQGMESVASLALRRRLSDHLGVPLPATLLWNHPTIAEVVPVLAARLADTADADLVAVGAAQPSGFELLLSAVESDGAAR